MIYIFIGLTKSGKTTAAITLGQLLRKQHNVGFDLIHPFDKGKRFIESNYGLPPYSLDRQEWKERLVLDLDDEPLIWEDGHSPSFQDLMVKEFSFRQEYDPFYSSRALRSSLKEALLNHEYGLTNIGIHGVRTAEEISTILKVAKEAQVKVKAIYTTRSTETAKSSDKYLEYNLGFLRSYNVETIHIVNDGDKDSLSKSLCVQVLHQDPEDLLVQTKEIL